jgi:hypothetical protein
MRNIEEIDNLFPSEKQEVSNVVTLSHNRPTFAPMDQTDAILGTMNGITIFLLQYAIACIVGFGFMMYLIIT